MEKIVMRKRISRKRVYLLWIALNVSCISLGSYLFERFAGSWAVLIWPFELPDINRFVGLLSLVLAYNLGRWLFFVIRVQAPLSMLLLGTWVFAGLLALSYIGAVPLFFLILWIGSLVSESFAALAFMLPSLLLMLPFGLHAFFEKQVYVARISFSESWVRVNLWGGIWIGGVFWLGLVSPLSALGAYWGLLYSLVTARDAVKIKKLEVGQNSNAWLED